MTDKGNHCIRHINLITAEVSTYAGICGTSGFKDGPYGINLFNNPDGIGIDEDGVLYVYDSGNRYMRIIYADGSVKTLINGACFDYKMEPSIPNVFKFKREYLLCLK